MESGPLDTLSLEEGIAILLVGGAALYGTRALRRLAESRTRILAVQRALETPPVE
ncbi:MAG: hypothetical protein HY554_14395 [Elusimicrobia bacterium]|nr:hypothetical protein [Elusimicrobiota bacterium]